MTSSRPTAGPIRVLDLELNSPLAPLEGLERYTSVFALVRARGVPLGLVEIPLEGGRCSAQVMQQRIMQDLPLLADIDASAPRDAQPSASLPEPSAGDVAADAGVQPPLTVAVCTRDRSADLGPCLDSLSALVYPRLEVLVVDNAPSDDATERLLATSYPRVRYVREPRPGLDWARNRAVREASGEIIAFTDDDVVVDDDWAAAIATAFAEASGDVMAVAGLVIPYELETDAQVFFERYGGFTAGFTREEFRGAREWGVRGAWHRVLMAQRFTGANLAFRRTVFDAVGDFDPALDVGTPTNGGGDLEILFRLLQEGYAIRYEPRAVVRHRHRRGYHGLRHQISGWGTGYAAFLVSGMLRYPAAAWVLALLGLYAIGQQVRRLARSFFDPPGFPRGLIVAEIAGLLLGPIRYVQARRRAGAVATKEDSALAELPSR